MPTATTATAIVVKQSPIVVDLNREAVARRDQLLQLARSGNCITTPEGAKKVSDIRDKLDEFATTIETLRVSAKGPLLEAGRKIDDCAKTLVVEINEEYKRLGRMLGEYQEEVKRKEEDARRAAWQAEQDKRAELRRKEQEQADRLAREKEDRERKAAEEAAALQAKADAEAKAANEKAARARSEASRQKAQADAAAALQKAQEEAAAIKARAEEESRKAEEKAQAEASSRLVETAEAIETAHAVANQIASTKVAGIRTGFDVEFKVIDIVALYESNPLFVKMEVKTGVLKSALRDLKEGEHIPGVEHWIIAKAK